VPFTYDLVVLGHLNRPPAFTSTPDTEALVGKSYVYPATASDPDGDPLTFSVVSGPAGLNIDKASGKVTWTPATTDLGNQAVVLRVQDTSGASAQQPYTLDVIQPPPNRPPVFTSTPVVDASFNIPYAYQATATDPDGDPLTFSVASGPTSMSIDPGSGLVTWTPPGGGSSEPYRISDTSFGPGNWTATKLSDTTPSPAQTSIATNQGATAGHPGNSQTVVESLAGPGNASYANVFGAGVYSPQQSAAIASLSLSFDVQQGTSYQTGLAPYGIASGDFNGDGRPDLMIANLDANTVSVLFQQADGAFGGRTDYNVGPNPRGVALGDFNGDGSLDAVVDDSGSGSSGNSSPSTYVTVLINDGHGAFQTTAYTVGKGPLQVAVGDVNKDGHLDILATDALGEVSVLLGLGNGTFASRSAFPTDVGAVGIALGDLNGDGQLDIVTGNFYGNNSISVLLGNGNGTFSAPTNYATPSASTGVALADFNGDGVLDVVVDNPGDGTAPTSVSVFRGLGNGTFAQSQRLDFPTEGRPGDESAVGDVNEDGIPDIVVATRELRTNTLPNTVPSNCVSVLLGRGDGTFAPKKDYWVPGISEGLVLKDLDGDGHLDIATTRLDGNKVSILYGNGDGTFDSEGTAFQPILVQAGSYYSTSKFSISQNGTREHVAATNVLSSDFTLLSGIGPLHPDFSATAAPIQLGYLMTSTSTSGVARTFVAALDNFSAAITPVQGGLSQHVPVTLAVADGRGGAATQAYTIQVGQAPGNHPPVIVSQAVTTAQFGQSYAYEVKAIDPDNDPVKYSLDAAPSGMSIDSTTGRISWAVPNPPPASITEFAHVNAFAGITAGPDGNIWFVEGNANKIGRMTTAGVITGEFSIPTPNSGPAGITAGPDGNIWFTEFNVNKIGRMTTAGVVTGEFSVPLPTTVYGSNPPSNSQLAVSYLTLTATLVHRNQCR
jgi:hypothetical protein